MRLLRLLMALLHLASRPGGTARGFLWWKGDPLCLPQKTKRRWQKSPGLRCRKLERRSISVVSPWSDRGATLAMMMILGMGMRRSKMHCDHRNRKFGVCAEAIESIMDRQIIVRKLSRKVLKEPEEFVAQPHFEAPHHRLNYLALRHNDRSSPLTRKLGRHRGNLESIQTQQCIRSFQPI